jgi:hypothetical protein
LSGATYTFDWIGLGLVLELNGQLIEKGQSIDSAQLSSGELVLTAKADLSIFHEPSVLITVAAEDADHNPAGTDSIKARLPQIELMVDANRDGNMSFDDTTIHDADQTTAQKPYTFWLNNDHDVYHKVDGDDFEYDDESDGAKDCNYTSIYTLRDLEDFARLRISFKGIVDLVKNPECQVLLEWRTMDGSQTFSATEGAPEIRVYQERQPAVRPLYLESESVAMAQRDTPYDTWIGGTRPGSSLDVLALRPSLRTALSETNPITNLLFCGVHAGRGQLLLTIKQGDRIIGQYPPVFLELLDIKDMYERWTVGEESGTDPDVLASSSRRNLPLGYIAPGHDRPFVYTPADREGQGYILYVHGWNMKPQEKDQFAETAYKRLFWQGYTGHFGAFQWPTTYGFGSLLVDDTKWKNGVNGIYSAVSDPTNYDRGEYSAWRSALALKRLFSRLNHDYPGKVYLLAHSMGNVVAGEALRIAAQEGLGQLVNTYVASQGAVPVHCYSGTQSAPLEAQVPVDILVRMFDGGYPQTPNVYPDWFSASSATVGRRINFYNVNDYALWQDVWQLNQYLKPDHSDSRNQGWNYRYVGDPVAAPADDGFRKGYGDPRNAGQNIALHLGTSSDIKDRYEIMAFAAESHSKALGATPNASGLSSSVDLASIWPEDRSGDARPYSRHKWHSAEFRSTNMLQKEYWKALIGLQGFNLSSQQ